MHRVGTGESAGAEDELRPPGRDGFEDGRQFFRRLAAIAVEKGDDVGVRGNGVDAGPAGGP